MDYLDYFSSKDDDDFIAKQNKGGNDNYICELIRKDLIDDFIIYLTKNCISVNSRINHSIFESNIFLIGKSPLLIEYAAFHGSIKIFQYLKMNSSEMSDELWLYAIHSKSGEIIHQTESLSIQPKDSTFVECFIESIKCHHNDVATYIENTNLDKEWSKFDHILESIIMSRNYAFYPKDKENYLKIVPFLLTNECFTLLKTVLNREFDVGLDEYRKESTQLNEYAYESYIVENEANTTKYVIKISKDDIYPSAIDEFSKIIECDYPSILKFHGYSPVDFNNEKQPAIIVDYFQHSLNDYIFSKKFVKSATNDYIMILGITIGMRYLHKKGIYHNLFCPQTILIDENLYPIISEFEVSNRLLDNHDQAFYPEDNKKFPYFAQEEIDGDASPAACNVYAFSYIIYQIVTKRFHFNNKKDGRGFRLLKNIQKGFCPNISCIESECVRKLITNYWDNDKEKRMTFDQILQYITNVEFINDFGSIDIYNVKAYLEIYGDEFKEIINKLLID